MKCLPEPLTVLEQDTGALIVPDEQAGAFLPPLLVYGSGVEKPSLKPVPGRFPVQTRAPP